MLGARQECAAPSLGAFLVEITYEESLLMFDSVDYGSFLGNPNDAIETDIVTTPSVGSVSLDEFSFLFDFELDALQPDSFSLATITFNSIGAGTSPLGFGLVDISDAEGISLMPTLSGAQVSAVPLPATVLLFPSGLLAWIGWLRRKNRISS